MMYSAEVVDGVVVRVIVGEAEGFIPIGPANTVGTGWLYVNGEFIPPQEEVE